MDLSHRSLARPFSIPTGRWPVGGLSVGIFWWLCPWLAEGQDDARVVGIRLYHTLTLTHTQAHILRRPKTLSQDTKRPEGERVSKMERGGLTKSNKDIYIYICSFPYPITYEWMRRRRHCRCCRYLLGRSGRRGKL